MKPAGGKMGRSYRHSTGEDRRHHRLEFHIGRTHDRIDAIAPAPEPPLPDPPFDRPAIAACPTDLIVRDDSMVVSGKRGDGAPQPSLPFTGRFSAYRARRIAR
jgi:hypothetical protein